MNKSLQRKLAVFLVLWWSASANATSITVILTPEHIAVAVDGKTSQFNDGQRVPASGRVSPKFKLFEGRIAIGTFGLAKIGVDPRPAFFVGDVFSGLKKKIRRESTITEAADAVAVQVGEALGGINESLAAKVITREILLEQTRGDNPLTGFVVAGYENAQAKLYLVKIEVDWESNKVVPPKAALLYPDPSQPTMNIFSSEKDEILSAIQWSRCRVPKDLPPSQEIEASAHAIADYALETKPDTVGLPITTIELFRKGKPLTQQYNSRMLNFCPSD
jgi:hypothetical protein